MKHGDLLNYKRIVRYRYDPEVGYNVEPEVFWRKLSQPFRYRMDPVPHVHKYGNGHYYRRVRTRNERCQWITSLEQGVTPRRRRSPRMLPTSWDDIMISVHGYHSWKRQKKRKQWMR